MVKINSTMRQKEIQALFDGKEFKGVTFHFKKKQGMSLVFDTEGGENLSKDDLKGIVKGQIKGDAMLKALMVTVDVV